MIYSVPMLYLPSVIELLDLAATLRGGGLSGIVSDWLFQTVSTMICSVPTLHLASLIELWDLATTLCGDGRLLDTVSYSKIVSNSKYNNLFSTHIIFTILNSRGTWLPLFVVMVDYWTPFQTLIISNSKCNDLFSIHIIILFTRFSRVVGPGCHSVWWW